VEKPSPAVHTHHLLSRSPAAQQPSPPSAQQLTRRAPLVPLPTRGDIAPTGLRAHSTRQKSPARHHTRAPPHLHSTQPALQTRLPHSTHTRTHGAYRSTPPTTAVAHALRAMTARQSASQHQQRSRARELRTAPAGGPSRRAGKPPDRNETPTAAPTHSTRTK